MLVLIEMKAMADLADIQVRQEMCLDREGLVSVGGGRREVNTV